MHEVWFRNSHSKRPLGPRALDVLETALQSQTVEALKRLTPPQLMHALHHYFGGHVYITHRDTRREVKTRLTRRPTRKRPRWFSIDAGSRWKFLPSLLRAFFCFYGFRFPSVSAQVSIRDAPFLLKKKRGVRGSGSSPAFCDRRIQRGEAAPAAAARPVCRGRSEGGGASRVQIGGSDCTWAVRALRRFRREETSRSPPSLSSLSDCPVPVNLSLKTPTSISGVSCDFQ